MIEPSVQRQSLESYVHDCKLLRRDYEQALQHWESINENGTPRYAVDFSEIHVYLLPGATSDPTALFQAPDSVSAALFDRAILKHLFAPADDKLILLSPYAAEFDGFLQWLELSELEHRAETALKLFQESRSALELPEFKEVKELISEVRETNREMSLSEQEKLLNFLQRNAPSVFAFTEEEFQDPLRSVGRLLASGIFEALRDLVAINGPDDKVFKRWYESLRKKRGEKAQVQSGIDAMAVALVAQANRSLRDSKTRLYLVTRSRTMHDVFENEQKAGFWGDFGYLLLHPRVFGILSSVKHKQGDDARADLRSRLTTIQLFLDTVEVGAIDQWIGGDESIFISALRDKIQQDWKATENLTIALTEANTPISVSDVPTQPDLIWMMNLLQNRVNLLHLLEERLDQLTAGLELEHQVLGLYYQSQGPQDRGILQLLRANEYPTVTRDGALSKWVVRTESHSMPYTLHFYTPEAGRVLEALTEKKSWQQVFGLLGRGLGTDTDYEIPLLIAYVLAVLNKWELAERYSQRALEVAGSRENMPTHEALFFYAISLRKANPSRDRHLESINYIRQAITAKRNWLNSETHENETYEDPRYLKELGSQILRINLYYEKKGNNPLPAEGLELLQTALERCQDDQLLRIQILNNKLHYRIESGELTDRNEIKDAVKDLLAAQQIADPDEARWSPAVLDTLARGSALAHEEPVPAEVYETILRWQQLAVASPYNSEDDRERMKRRLHGYRTASRKVATPQPDLKTVQSSGRS